MCASWSGYCDYTGVSQSPNCPTQAKEVWVGHPGKKTSSIAVILNVVTPQTVTLIASILALVGSLLTILVGTRLTLLKERRQLLWSKELERFLALEELAG